jgi:uncharacterized protein YceK
MAGRLALVALLGISGLALSGCGSILTESTAAVSGVAGAATGAAITSNATVAAAVGLGVDSAALEGLDYVERHVHHYEQERIATAAGPLPVGAVANWSVSHDLPIESDEHGQVVVSRAFGAMDFQCKEVVFSVDTVEKHIPHRAFYTTTICSDGHGWHWANAEPTTSRWSGLQ